MKKFNLLFLGLLAIAAVFVTSCGGTNEEDHAAPVVTIDNAAATIEANENVAFTGTVTSLGELKEVKFFVGGNLYGDAITSFDDVTNYTFRVEVDSMTESYTFKVRATDELGLETEKSIDMTINDAPAYEVGEYSSVGLEYTSTSLSALNMFNMGTGTALAGNATAADLDLAFCWQNTYEYSIVPPNSTWLAALYSANSITYTTSDKNATKLAVSTVDYSTVTVDDIDGIAVTATDDLQNLANGTVIEFETVNGEKGFMKVNIAKVTKNITVDVKYKTETSAK